jgi:hypothetical protein
MERECERLRRELEAASNATKETNERLRSLSELFELMGRAEEKERISLTG